MNSLYFFIYTLSIFVINGPFMYFRQVVQITNLCSYQVNRPIQVAYTLGLTGNKLLDQRGQKDRPLQPPPSSQSRGLYDRWCPQPPPPCLLGLYRPMSANKMHNLNKAYTVDLDQRFWKLPISGPDLQQSSGHDSGLMCVIKL